MNNSVRQHKILSVVASIQNAESGSLCATMRRRRSLRDILARKVVDAGNPSTPEIAKRAVSRGYEVTPTAIREMLREGGTKNPGIYTLEATAIGLNLTPIQFLAEVLGDRMEEGNFKEGALGVAAEIYRSMTPKQKAKADQRIEDLILLLQSIKNQN